MIENVVTTISDEEDNVIKVVTTNDILLEALCAYRDKVFASEPDYDIEKSTKLAMIAMAIDDVVKDIPVK